MIEKRFDTPNPVRLQVRLAAGAIDVTTVEAAESVVTLDGSERMLEATTVEQHGDRVVVQQRHGFRFFDRFDLALAVTVVVPPGSRVETVSAAGDTTLEGTFGRVDVRAVAGTIVARGAVEGDANLKTVSGDVRVQRVTGDLDVRTVSGDVSVGSLSGGKASVRSVSGDVELGVAAGTNVDVDASSASGELTSDVPLSAAPTGGAGPRLVVRGKTVSGDFRLVRAAER